MTSPERLAHPLRDLGALAEHAGVPLHAAEHYAPLLRLLAALLPDPAVRSHPPVPPGFDVHKSYSAPEAAAFLGVARKSVYEIPEAELARVRVGGARTAVRFVGLDLLCYRHKLPPVDWAAVRDEAEQQLLRAPAGARGVRSGPAATGPRRVV